MSDKYFKTKKMTAVALFMFIAVSGCNSTQSNEQPMSSSQSENTDKQDANQLADQLISSGFAELFYAGERSALTKIWNDGANRDELVKLVYDEPTSPHVRFLAAEVLRNYKVPLKEDAFGLLAESYTIALTNTAHATGSDSYGVAGNSWGELTPGYVGFLGKEVIRFGEASVPYLVPLLDDDTQILFDGSKEATTAAMYRFRVKDFAAFYLSDIRNIPIDRSTDPEIRNKEIARLKKILAEQKNGQK